MVKYLLLACIFILSHAADIRWWDVNSNLGYISDAKFTTYNSNLFLWLKPYGVFRFNNNTQTWQSMGLNAAQAQNNFIYSDSFFSTGEFFKQKNDKSQRQDPSLWNDILKKYRIKVNHDTLFIVEFSTDTMQYILLTPYSGYGDERINFFDGKNIWFSIGVSVGDAGYCAGFGCFDTRTKESKMFSFEELDIKDPGIPYYHMTYGSPSIFALFNNDLWMGTVRASDYGPEPHGEGIYIFDINKKTKKNHIYVGGLENSPSVLDISFNPNYLWIATTLGIYRLHCKNNTWSYWKLDTCAIITDSIMDLSLWNNSTKFYGKIPKGKIVRLIGQSGGGHESQTGAGSTIKSMYLLEGWIIDTTLFNQIPKLGDTIDIRFFKLYESHDTSSMLLLSCQDQNRIIDFIKAIYCENQGYWHRIKLCQIWLPFEDLKYKLQKCAISNQGP